MAQILMCHQGYQDRKTAPNRQPPQRQMDATISIPSSFFGTLSDELRRRWAHEDPVKKKAVAAHFVRINCKSFQYRL